MLVKRSLSGKHFLLWIAALVAVGIAVVLGALVLNRLVHRVSVFGSASLEAAGARE